MPPRTPRLPRFLIGNGDKLTEDKKYVSSPKPAKSPAYTVSEAIERLAPRVHRTVRSILATPPAARPRDEAVALLTLHPEFLAKSAFPGALLSGIGLRTVGSRARKLQPERWTPNHKHSAQETETIELYVAGPVSSFAHWAEGMRRGAEYKRGVDELPRVEDVRPLESLDESSRIKLPSERGNTVLLEAAIHLPDEDGREIVQAFLRYAASLDVHVEREVGLTVPGLAFAPVRVPRAQIAKLAQFTFLRSLRPVVRLRPIPPSKLTRSLGAPFSPPSAAPLNPSIRVAILDGGLPDNHGLPYVNHYHTPGVGGSVPGLLDHGMAVTGAFMWGSLHNGAGQQYASVDHFRVLDDAYSMSDSNAYRVLRRIQDVVETGSHDIFNLSLGPDLAVDDDEVHPWTSTLDDLAADGSRLIVAAAGNNGTMPHPECRIQVPGDGVNCLCVGAVDDHGDEWKRAEYSAKGPGRRPGLTKPDVVAFGGSASSTFRVIRKRGSSHTIDDEQGTSFATPLVTRAAAALRSLFSSNLQPLTLKCLLVHSASPNGHVAHEVGWGRVAAENDLPLCPPNTARVIYQGELPPKKFLRAKIPVPRGLSGKVEITATVCYATQVRASDPLNYTNSGVEITFRPNAKKFAINKQTKKPGTYPKPAPFFKQGEYATEEEKRTRDRKWETVLHASKMSRVDKLDEPVFDLHFIPRLGAMDHADAGKIRYAMVISVRSSRHEDIYERVLAEFPQLQALTPVTLHATV